MVGCSERYSHNSPILLRATLERYFVMFISVQFISKFHCGCVVCGKAVLQLSKCTFQPGFCSFCSWLSFPMQQKVCWHETSTISWPALRVEILWCAERQQQLMARRGVYTMPCINIDLLKSQFDLCVKSFFFFALSAVIKSHMDFNVHMVNKYG